jgi:hypothetical protein
MSILFHHHKELMQRSKHVEAIMKRRVKVKKKEGLEEIKRQQRRRR